MQIKQHIFGSKSEQDVYYYLKEKFPTCRVQHNLPLLNVLDALSEDAIRSWEFANAFGVVYSKPSPRGRDYIKKASIDFTFTDENDKPLFSLEYDGHDGESAGGLYIPYDPFVDKLRVFTLDTKLGLCLLARYPLHVIGPNVLKPIAPGHDIKMIDLIVGGLLASSNGKDYALHLNWAHMHLRTEIEDLLDQLRFKECTHKDLTEKHDTREVEPRSPKQMTPISARRKGQMIRVTLRDGRSGTGLCMLPFFGRYGSQTCSSPVWASEIIASDVALFRAIQNALKAPVPVLA
jgi:hypothetical protein